MRWQHLAVLPMALLVLAGLAGAQNLVQNPSFELYTDDGNGNLIPDDWTGYATTDPAWEESWFQSLTADDIYGHNDGARTGERFGVCVGGTSVPAPQERNGGVYQVVSGLTPDEDYALRVWFHTDCRTLVGPAGQQTYAEDVQVRIGIDPNGGTDPAAATWSVWSYTPDNVDARQIYLRLHLNFTSVGDTATVFLEYKQIEDPEHDHQIMWCAFEDVSLEEGTAFPIVSIIGVHSAIFYQGGGEYLRHQAWSTAMFTPPADFDGYYADGKVEWGTTSGVYPSSVYDDTTAVYHNTRDFSGAQIKAGPDGVCDSQATGDDVQVVPYGTTGLDPETMVVHSGPDHTLDTTPGNDDVTDTMDVDGLAPDTLYYYQITSGGTGVEAGTVNENDLPDALAQRTPVQITSYAANPTTYGETPPYTSKCDFNFRCNQRGSVTGFEGKVDYGYFAGGYYWSSGWVALDPGSEDQTITVDGLYPNTDYHAIIKVRLDDHPDQQTPDIAFHTPAEPPQPPPLPDRQPTLLNGDRYRRTGSGGEVLDGVPAQNHKHGDFWEISGSDYWYSWFQNDPAWNSPWGTNTFDLPIVNGCSVDSWCYQAFYVVPGEDYEVRTWSRGYNGRNVTDPNYGPDCMGSLWIDGLGQSEPNAENPGTTTSGEWWWVSPLIGYMQPQMRDMDTGGPYGNGWFWDSVGTTAPMETDALTFFTRMRTSPTGWMWIAYTDTQLWGAAKVSAGGPAKGAGTLVDGWNLISVPMYFVGDDEQILAVGNGDTEAVCVGPGENGILESFASGDDVEDFVNQVIRVGPNGICDTEADVVFTDDTQDLPVGSGPRCVGPGPDGRLETTATGDDFVYGTYIVSGPNGVCDTVADDNDGDGVPSYDASEVFEDLVAAGNLIATNMYNYTPGSGYGLYPTAWTKIEVGRGYWLRLDNAADNVVRHGELLGTDQRISLVQGWNMIGHPFVFAVPLADCMVSQGGGEPVSMQTAVDNGWIQDPLYYYEGLYKTCRITGGDSQSLEPWRGYWALTYVDDLELIIPIPRPATE